jgi:hypothetical protein
MSERSVCGTKVNVRSAKFNPLLMRAVLFLTILLAGCSSIQQTENRIKPPELVKSAPLPLILSVVPGGGGTNCRD